MKKALLSILVGIILLTIGYWIGYMKSFAEGVANDLNKKKANIEWMQPSATAEQFDSFFEKFISDSTFQLSRIKFPLASTTLVNGDEYLTEKLQISDWKYTPLYSNDTYTSQIYDNFQMKLRNSDERMFCWKGIENGICIQYMFKCICERWFLIEYNDFST